MPVRFGYDESLPDNWTNTGDTYNGPGIASNMQSFGMNGSPYSALVPQGQANPFAGTLAMNPGATDTNNFGAWEAQFQNPAGAGGTGWNGSPQGNPNPGWNASTGSWNPGYGPGQTNSTPPVIGSPSLTGGGQRPASAGNGFANSLPFGSENVGGVGMYTGANAPLDLTRFTPVQNQAPTGPPPGSRPTLDPGTWITPTGATWNAPGAGRQQNEDYDAYMNRVYGPIEQREQRFGPGYHNPNRGGYPAPAATQPGTTGQPTQNGSVGGAPQFNWPNLPQVDPATAYGGGVLDLMGRDSRGYAEQLTQGQRLFLASGGSPSDMMGMTNARYQQPAMQAAPGSMEERYAAMYGGGGNYQSRYPSASSGMQGIGEVSSYNPFGSGPPPNYGSGGYATGGMDQPWNQGGGGRAATNPNWNGMNDYSIPGGYQFGGSPQGGDPMQQLYQLYQQNPQLFNYGQNGGQVSGYGGGVQDYTNGVSYDGGRSWMGGVAAQNAAPGSMQQRNQAYFQNPGATFGSAAAGGGTSNSSGSGGGSSATPIMASPSFGFGSATGRRTGYGNQNSYYGGSSNPNSFGGSNFGNFSTASYGSGGNSATNRPYIYPNSSQSSNSSGGFAAGRTGRPSSFTF